MRIIRGLTGSLLACSLGACYGPLPDGDGTAVPLYGDTIVDVTSKMAGSVRLIDSVGRARSAAPERMEEAVPSWWLRDFFGNAFEYSASGHGFSIRSKGRDGVPGTDDDIVATGRIGRAFPCEIRTERHTIRYEESAPPCTEAPIIVLPFCQDVRYLPLADPGRRGRRDPSLATGELLARLARRIDGEGRHVGGLPPSVPAVDHQSQDAWGGGVMYERTGRTFELRSAGPDRTSGTSDDIVVRAELGGVIPCAFTQDGAVRTCPEPAPQCPGAGEPIVEIEPR